jgi:hypothetical protein
VAKGDAASAESNDAVKIVEGISPLPRSSLSEGVLRVQYLKEEVDRPNKSNGNISFSPACSEITTEIYIFAGLCAVSFYLRETPKTLRYSLPVYRINSMRVTDLAKKATFFFRYYCSFLDNVDFARVFTSMCWYYTVLIQALLKQLTVFNGNRMMSGN